MDERASARDQLSYSYGENPNLHQDSLTIQWISVLRNWVWGALKNRKIYGWLGLVGGTERSQNGASLDNLFSPLQEKEGKSPQRQTCLCPLTPFCLYPQCSSAQMFLSSKHLSEKIQPKCHLPQAFLLWAEQFLNIMISYNYNHLSVRLSSPTRLRSQGQYLCHLCISSTE